MTFRITYSVLDADMSEVHAAFDDGLSSARAKRGAVVPSWIDGEAVESGELLSSHSPIDGALLCQAHAAPVSDLDRAIAAAKRAQREWAALPGRSASRPCARRPT